MISVAWAQAGGESVFGGFEVLLPMVAVFVVFYFLLIRPQQKKAKEHQSKLSAIVKGDEVLTGGGFYGKVVKAEDNDLWVRLADGVEVRILRTTVMDKLEKGTIKGSGGSSDKKGKPSKAKPKPESKPTEKLAVESEVKKVGKKITKSAPKKASLKEKNLVEASADTATKPEDSKTD